MMKKLIIRILSIILILAIFIGLIPPTKSQAVIVPDIETEVYYISSAIELTTLNSELYDKFILTEDIEIDGNWIPISDFKGTFDGSGHTITYNLSEATGPIPTSNPQLGLFASCTDATIKNLYVKGNVELTTGGSYFNPSIYVGGIIGNSTNSTLENVHFSGNINITTSNDNSSWVGGLIGQATDTNISFSSNEANITTKITSAIGITWTGGLCGKLDGEMKKCYNNGKVLASVAGESSYAGGLVGNNMGSIRECYNAGIVQSEGPNFNLGKIFAGGIVAKGEDNSFVEDCAVMSEEVSIKLGWVNSGYNYIISNGGTKSGNISIDAIAGKPTDDSNTRYSKSDLKTRNPYVNFDFYNTWNVNDSYPYFDRNPYAVDLDKLILPELFGTLLGNSYASLSDFKQTSDGFTLCTRPVSEILLSVGLNENEGISEEEGGNRLLVKDLNDWYFFSVGGSYSILKMRGMTDNQKGIGISIPFMDFDMNELLEIKENLENADDVKPHMDKFFTELYRMVYTRFSGDYMYSYPLAIYFTGYPEGCFLVGEEYIKMVVEKDRDEDGYLIVPDGISNEQKDFLEDLTDIYDAENKRIKIIGDNLTRTQKLAVLDCRSGNSSLTNFTAEVILHAVWTMELGDFLAGTDKEIEIDGEILDRVAGWTRYTAAIKADAGIGEEKFYKDSGPVKAYEDLLVAVFGYV